MGIKLWWPALFVGAIALACFLIFPSDLRVADLFGKAAKYDRAIKNYEHVLKAEPERPDARIALSRLYLLNEEPEKALAEIEKVGIETITDAALLHQIADVYSGLGDRAGTVAVLEQLVELNPEPSHKLRLADAYIWNAQPNSAQPLYEALLAAHPNDPSLLLKLTHLHLSQREFRASFAYLDHLVDLRPKDTEALSLRADTRIEIGERLSAAADYESVLQLKPDNAEIRRRLAELYVWMSKPERGLKHYDYLVRRHPENAPYFDRFMTLAYDFEPDLAMWHFLRRLQAEPQNRKLRERFIDLCLHIGDTDQAVHQMQVLIAQHPDDLQYRKLLAYLYQDLRQPHLARQVFEEMFEKDFVDREVIDELIQSYRYEKRYHKLAALYTELRERGYRDTAMVEGYAELLVKMRNYDQAIAQYEALLERQPGHADTRLSLAELYLYGGRKQHAAAVLKDGMATYDIQTPSYLAAASQFFAEHEFLPESIAAYERLVESAPRNVQHRRSLIQQYTKAGDLEAAAEHYEQLLTLMPADVATKLDYAGLKWLQQDFTAMQALLDQVERAPATNGVVHRRLGRFYFERGYFEDAIRHLKSEQQTAPNDSTTLRMLGLSYAWNSQPSKAKQVLKQYHQLYPADYYTHYQLGELYLAEANRDQAWQSFDIALNLIEGSDQEQQIVLAKIYSHLGKEDEVAAIFAPLLTGNADSDVRLDYVECLVNLKDYARAEDWLQQVLAKEPQNYRALRLRSSSYYRQGRYADAAATLRQVQQIYPRDIGVGLDLAESQLQSGDWYASTQSLKHVLDTYPNHGPAQERLLRLRRTRGERVAAEFRTAQQSDNLVRRVYNVVLSKATSSLLHVKLWLGQESYSTRDESLPEREFTHVGAKAASSYNARLQTELETKARHTGDAWYLTLRGTGQWNFDVSNSIALSADLNALWNDPFTAAFLNGRLHRLQSQLSLSPTNRLYFWNQVAYERHYLNNARFGEAVRGNVLAGYRLLQRPEVSAFYNLYFLKYRYRVPGGANVVSIPNEDAVHYVGSTIAQQVTRRLFYQFSGSLGYNSVRQEMTIYGTANLEFFPHNQLRLRSVFEYGSQSQLANRDRNASLFFDFSYFY